MTEMRLKESVFYVLDVGSSKTLFDTEGGAITALKVEMAKNKELNPDGASILEVDTKGEKWNIKSISWSKIAMALMRG